MTILTDKPEVDQIDAALLVEELIEIYSTPTLKGWREAKRKVIDIDCKYILQAALTLYYL